MLTYNPYEKIAHEYIEKRKIAAKSLYNDVINDPAILRALSELDVIGPSLDVGCGQGSVTAHMPPKRYGIDPSPTMIESAKSNALADYEADFKVAFAENIPFTDGSFSTIVSSLALHYSPNIDECFTEFARALRKNGQLVFTIHHPHQTQAIDIDNKSVTTKKLYGNGERYRFQIDEFEPLWAHHYSKSYLENRLLANGFANIEVRDVAPDKSLYTNLSCNLKEQIMQCIATPPFVLITALKAH